MREMIPAALIANMLALAAGAAQSAGGDLYSGPMWVDSLKECASGTRGRTAHKEFTFSAGADRVFLPQSLRVAESTRGDGTGDHWFAIRQIDFVDVPVQIEGGGSYTIAMPRVVVVQAHAETGSGPTNIGRCTWLNGYFNAETMEVDK